jgi:hypothetical protein
MPAATIRAPIASCSARLKHWSAVTPLSARNGFMSGIWPSSSASAAFRSSSAVLMTRAR